MKSTDKTILIAIPLIAALIGFWFLVVSPKRQEASKLQDDVATLQASVETQEQEATAAEAARQTFPSDYHHLVVMGKAVPEDADTSSLLVQLNRLAENTSVSFDSLKLVAGGGSATPAAPAVPTPATDASAAQSSEAQVANVESGATPSTTAPAVDATESAVASQPIGATVGPAGLPTMPYNLSFEGRFFNVADFIGKLDSQVGVRSDGAPTVFGRLVTIDGFSLSLPDTTGSAESGPVDLTDPMLQAHFAVTTFVVPGGEGLTDGASPAGPAPSAPTPVSTTGAAVPSPPAADIAGGTP